MLKICYSEEHDHDFIRWTGNLLRSFLASGLVRIVGARDQPDLMLASIWRRHRFPRNVPVVLVTNENWEVFPPRHALSRYRAVIGVCPPPQHLYRDVPPGQFAFIQYPYEAVHFPLPLEQLFEQRERRLRAPKSRFCCFVVSNTVGNLARRRLEVFRQVHAYEPVDAAGAVANNTGYRAPRGLDFLDWIAQYRFMISLENSDAPGYVTEKALQASLSGAVPIYAGGGAGFFNRDAFIDASAPDFLEELARLDNDPLEYQRRQRLELYRTRPSLKVFEDDFARVLLQ